MIPKDCKRLAEVDFPIAAVSKHAAREKYVRNGHPNTLHLWWARRPLASSRAVLLSLLLPDPCDRSCPLEFKTKARQVLPQVGGTPGPTDADLRKHLLRFVADFANWDHSAHPAFLQVGRALIKAAHGEEAPLVVDPFAGGGSIPLESLRLGCDTFASDLNPVACLILKVLLEDIPRQGTELADELRGAGAQIRSEVERKAADLYPKDRDGATPIAYLWARTVRCEAPSCGAEIPLFRSLWLTKKRDRRRALRYRAEKPKGGTPHVAFEIFEPMSEDDVRGGTVSRAKATCIACGTALAPDRVCAQLAAQRGGADVVFDSKGQRTGGARLLAVVTLKSGETGRIYRLPLETDYRAVFASQQRLARLLQQRPHGEEQEVCPIPNELLPPIGTLGFRVQRYGMLEWGDLFTARQKLALLKLGRGIGEAVDPNLKELLALTLDGVVDRNAVLATWRPQADQEKVEHVFVRQALPMSWDFAEAVPISDATGSLKDRIDNTHSVMGALSAWSMQTGRSQAHVQLADAVKHPLPDDSAGIYFTDPPYYDAVPYSDLSDFFLVWLKRALPMHPLLRDPFDLSNTLTPKRQEAVQDETKRDNGRVKDRVWFEETMARAFAEGRRILRDDGVGSVVFAHKTTEGWEALLSGMIRGGWTITGSWPIATEMGARLRARDSAALATSIHLICRPRQQDASVGDWASVLRELPRRVSEWMLRLESEGVHGADLVFACIGPALEIFSRYARVETADGREVPLAEYLVKVWEVVGRAALEQVLGTAEANARNGGLGALEEDSRLTALFLWTLNAGNTEASDDTADDASDDEEDDDDEEGTSSKKPKGLTLIYDIVRRFAQPLGIHLDAWEGRIVETKKGVVRLLPVAERARQLFGEAGAEALASTIEKSRAKAAQLELFPDSETKVAKIKPKGRKKAAAAGSSTAYTGQVTTLDRVHAAMLFQRQGQTNALRSLLAAEIERGPDFVRLANALSALYPRDSDEKRLLDAMLLALPRR